MELIFAITLVLLSLAATLLLELQRYSMSKSHFKEVDHLTTILNEKDSEIRNLNDTLKETEEELDQWFGEYIRVTMNRDRFNC